MQNCADWFLNINDVSKSVYDTCVAVKHRSMRHEQRYGEEEAAPITRPQHRTVCVFIYVYTIECGNAKIIRGKLPWLTLMAFGSIQVLRNAMRGGGTRINAGQHYEGVWSSTVSVTRGWGLSSFHRKSVSYHLSAPLFLSTRGGLVLLI